MKEYYNGRIAALKNCVADKQSRIDNLFSSVAQVFGEESNEMLLLVTELTLGAKSAEFFASFGSESYEKYNALLMVDDRKESLRKEILNIL